MEDTPEQSRQPGGYHAALAAFAAKLRVSPRADWDSLAIVTGRLHMRKSARRTYYTLFTPDSVIRVRWRCDDPPPGLTQGQRIVVYGKLTTYELGNRATIDHALTLRVKKFVFRRLLTGVFDKIGLTVAQYNDFKAAAKPLPTARPKRKERLPRHRLPEWMEGVDKE